MVFRAILCRSVIIFFAWHLCKQAGKFIYKEQLCLNDSDMFVKMGRAVFMAQLSYRVVHAMTQHSPTVTTIHSSLKTNQRPQKMFLHSFSLYCDSLTSSLSVLACTAKYFDTVGWVF